MREKFELELEGVESLNTLLKKSGMLANHGLEGLR